MEPRKSIIIGSISAILLGTFLYFQSHKQEQHDHIHTAQEQKQINSQIISDPVELIYTEQEQREMGKWKDKTMDDLVMDAMTGDRAALCNLGGYFLLGLGFSIDVQQANIYFARSASLGFAPALDQISKMYINDEANAFLGLVYKNLTISFGHTEFVQGYHKLRSNFITDAGKSGLLVMDEIERIATKKRLLILKNQEYVKNAQANDKKACWLSVKNITDEDYQYDHDYWQDVFNNDHEELEFSKIKEHDKPYLEKMHSIYYQAITPGDKDCELKIQAIMKEMKNNSYSDSEIEALRKDAKCAAKKNYKFIIKIENDAKEARKRLEALEKEEDSL